MSHEQPLDDLSNGLRDRPVLGDVSQKITSRTKGLPWSIDGTAVLSAIGVLMVLVLVVYGETLNAFGYSVSLLLLIAIFVSASVSSVAGFAFSAICGAILFHLSQRPVQIVEIMLVCSIALQLFSVIALRNDVNWQCLSRFLLGGLLGLPIGVYLLIYVSPMTYMKCVGAFLVAYGTYMLFRRTVIVKATPAATDVAVGFLGGITGGFAGFPGAFVTVWCGFKGWDKNRQRGVFQPFILIMQVVTLLLLSVVGALNSRTPRFELSTLAYVPAALFGTWCGISIFRRLTDVQFARWVNGLLIISGIGLLL